MIGYCFIDKIMQKDVQDWKEELFKKKIGRRDSEMYMKKSGVH